MHVAYQYMALETKTNCFDFNRYTANMKVVYYKLNIDDLDNGYREEENLPSSSGWCVCVFACEQEEWERNWSKYFNDRLVAVLQFSLWMRSSIRPNTRQRWRNMMMWIQCRPLSVASNRFCKREEVTMFQSKQRLKLACHPKHIVYIAWTFILQVLACRAYIYVCVVHVEWLYIPWVDSNWSWAVCVSWVKLS